MLFLQKKTFSLSVGFCCLIKRNFPWTFYGSHENYLQTCCITMETVRRHFKSCQVAAISVSSTLTDCRTWEKLTNKMTQQGKCTFFFYIFDESGTCSLVLSFQAHWWDFATALICATDWLHLHGNNSPGLLWYLNTGWNTDGGKKQNYSPFQVVAMSWKRYQVTPRMLLQ